MAAIFPRWATLRYVMPVTIVPSRTRSVAAARKPSVVQLSSMSSQACPIPGICRKWSMTHRLSKPASSAAAAISRRRRAISAGPPGHVKRGSCRPKRIVVRSPSAPRSAASAAGTTVTGPGGWTAANPSSARASRTAGQPLSCALTTAVGTVVPRARFRARISAGGTSKAMAKQGTPAASASAR